MLKRLLKIKKKSTVYLSMEIFEPRRGPSGSLSSQNLIQIDFDILLGVQIKVFWLYVA